MSNKNFDWHDWFAWRPVNLAPTMETVWLKKVKRKCVLKYGEKSWEYRDIKCLEK